MALKGIEKVAAKFCVETALYWGNPQDNRMGGFTFDPPIEIKCRWTQKEEVNIGWFSQGYPGNLILSKASVMVLQDLDLSGYLFLGTLADIDVTQNPKTITGAYVIHRFDKIPMVFKKDEFVRTAWLYDQGK